MSPRASAQTPARQPTAPTPRRRPRSGVATTGETDSAPAKVNVGQRLRALRTERGLSIRALAQMSGLNFNTLGLIENSKCSPSVSTLQQLALGLAVPITAFFETDAPKKHLAYVKAGQRANAAFAHGSLADLGSGLAERAIEPFVITLAPNLGSGQTPIVHTGHEFVFCLKGRLLYTIENQSYLLTPGDSLLFEAHLPHCWQNVDVDTSQALLVLCPADARDQPTALHFALK
jgi:transcriptional regulator with XRE-family HTH domain